MVFICSSRSSLDRNSNSVFVLATKEVRIEGWDLWIEATAVFALDATGL
jgi:hypothetical protein